MALTIIALFIMVLGKPPIAQDPAYHGFADTRVIAGVPNFWNVSSNLAFMLVAVYGLYTLLVKNSLVILDGIKLAYVTMFAGTFLVGAGSAYYHVVLDNNSLFWDRLPMTIVFMSIYTVVIAEFIDEGIAKRLFLPLLMLGCASAIYWIYTESLARGDLRFYALVAFIPMLTIPVIVVLFDSKFSLGKGYLWLIVFYLAAKVSEHYDAEIYQLLGFVSGHTLKHLFAASGLLVLVLVYQKRLARN